MLLAHLGHWTVLLAYLVPVVGIVAVLLVGAFRAKRGKERRGAGAERFAERPAALAGSEGRAGPDGAELEGREHATTGPGAFGALDRERDWGPGG